MPHDLSVRSKKSIQAVSFLATVLVVGIHYKSDVPDSSSWAGESWNELLQEFCFGGLARVAVPLFSVAAGLLYFRSHDGSWGCYRDKWLARCRSVLLPYFIVGSVATVCWLLVQRLQSGGHELGPAGLLSRWLLRPPAEQLWFLRDLMVLVTAAPLLPVVTRSRRTAIGGLALLAVGWFVGWQPFPNLGGWYVLNLETLFFFAVGAALARRVDWVNAAAEMRSRAVASWCGLWLTLVTVRVVLRPDFDIWYTARCGWPDLLVHQASILVGCVALFAVAGRIDSDRIRHWSGVSFFVFLTHEFPLRAFVDKAVERMGDWPSSFWLVFPLVTVFCFAAGLLTSRGLPAAFALLTGGRTPGRAAAIAGGNRASGNRASGDRARGGKDSSGEAVVR